MNPDLGAERQTLGLYLATPPDKTLALVSEMDLGSPQAGEDEAIVYAYPMHPQVMSEGPAKCPRCGMKLIPEKAATTYGCPMRPEVVRDAPGPLPEVRDEALQRQARSAGEGSWRYASRGQTSWSRALACANRRIESEDDMPEVNRMTTPANMRWMLIDGDTGAQNAAIDWHFRVGDRVKILDSDHPMPHPFHIHSAGRFLILSRDGVPEQNLAWKDTVLCRTGQVVDILLEVANPGLRMAHCHIAEHIQSDMMFSLTVAR